MKGLTSAIECRWIMLAHIIEAVGTSCSHAAMTKRDVVVLEYAQDDYQVLKIGMSKTSRMDKRR